MRGVTRQSGRNTASSEGSLLMTAPSKLLSAPTPRTTHLTAPKSSPIINAWCDSTIGEKYSLVRGVLAHDSAIQNAIGSKSNKKTLNGPQILPDYQCVV